MKLLVASYARRPAPPDLLRALPAPVSPSPPPPPQSAPPPPWTTTAATGPVEAPARPARVAAISGELQTLRITVGGEFVADLEAARSALSHVIPNGELVAVLHEGLRRVVRDHLRRAAGTTERPRAARPSKGDRRDPAAAVRREVW